MTDNDITQEPPVGSQVMSTFGQFWERDERGWFRRGPVPMIARLSWTRVRADSPLHLATDRDREWAGLNRRDDLDACHACNGSGVVEDYEGDRSCLRCDGSGTPPSAAIHATLALTDQVARIADAMTTEGAPEHLPWQTTTIFHVDVDDPDERLAKVAKDAFYGTNMVWDPSDSQSEDWRDVARAAREHIDASRFAGAEHWRNLAEDAERERDEANSRAEAAEAKVEEMRGRLHAETRRAEKAEAEVDKTQERADAVGLLNLRVARERDEAKAERDEAERQRIVGDKRIRQLEAQVETKQAKYDDLLDRIRAKRDYYQVDSGNPVYWWNRIASDFADLLPEDEQ